MIKPDRSPSFLLIGATKSGTSSIHQYLRQDPKISLPKKKETHFFIMDKDGIQPEPYYDRRLRFFISDIDEYLNFFENDNPDAIRGEIDPSYLIYPNAARNIFSRVPNAKIFAILRQPVARFYSAVNFRTLNESKISGEVSEHTPEEIENEVRKLIDGKGEPQYEMFFDGGLYYKHLLRYYELFPKENIKVFLYRELVQDPQKLLNTILAEIGLPEFEFNTSTKFNTSGKVKNLWLYQILKKIPNISNIRRRIPSNTYEYWRQKLEQLIVTKNRNGLSEATNEILRKMYYEDTMKLQDLIQKDLSDWNKDA